MKPQVTNALARGLGLKLMLALGATLWCGPAVAQKEESMEQIEAMEERIQELGVRRDMLPSAERMAALESNLDDHPVYMLNLLKFYPNGGQAEYMKYGAAAQKRLGETGASMLFMGQAMPLADGSKPYDAIAVVNYPTRKGLRRLEESDEYRAALVHRDRGLDHQILYAFNAETPRSTTGGERVLQAVEPAAAPASPQALTLVELLKFKPEGGESKYFNEYIPAVRPMFEALGGRMLHVLKGEQVMIGEAEYDWVLIVEFPSPAAAAALGANPEYQKIRHLREEALAWDQVLPCRNMTAMAAMAAQRAAAASDGGTTSTATSNPAAPGAQGE